MNFIIILSVAGIAYILGKNNTKKEITLLNEQLINDKNRLSVVQDHLHSLDEQRADYELEYETQIESYKKIIQEQRSEILELQLKNESLDIEEIEIKNKYTDKFYEIIDSKDLSVFSTKMQNPRIDKLVMEYIGFTKPVKCLLERLMESLPEIHFMTEQPLRLFLDTDKSIDTDGFLGKRLAMFRFDIVAYNKDFKPLFVIEVDGNSHTNPNQIKCDIAKSRLTTELIGIPVIRIQNKTILNEQKLTTALIDISQISQNLDQLCFFANPDNKYRPRFGFITNNQFVDINTSKVIKIECSKKFTKNISKNN